MTAGSDQQRCIAHVDMDAFYASVEQRDRPELRGLPVLVGGSGNRGVVAAASYEARQFGIRSAMPATEARRRCPDAMFVKPRMSHYKQVSRAIFRVFGEFTPEVEGLSLDEAYLDLTASLKLFGAATDLGIRIKERVKEETGLNASVGIGPNKLVAKIASDLDKPDGLCILFGRKIAATLDPLSVSVIGGIGPKTAQRLDGLGILTVSDLRSAPDKQLERVFGRYAARMRQKASGVDDRPICSHRPDQSISAEETFSHDISDPAVMRRKLADLAQRVASRIRAKGLQASVVTIKVRKSDFQTYSRQRRVTPAVRDEATLLRLAVDLLTVWLVDNPGARLRLLGVGVAGLSDAAQLGLFSDPSERLECTLDSIRDRFGEAAMRTGRPREQD
jgi:DNA polymerase-4